MTDPTCGRCEKALRHEQAMICGSCGAHLRGRLGRTANLAGQVAITIARLDRMPSAGPGTPDELGWWKTGDALEPIAMPFNPEASDRFRAAWAELATWARHCCEERGIDYASTGLDGLCGFLASQVEWLRHRDEAGEAWPAIEAACNQVERIVDTRVAKVLVGRCPCEAWLYAHPDDAIVACEQCGTSYDIAASRADLLAQAHEVWANATWLAGTLTLLGVRCTDAMVRGYAHRGRLMAHPELDGRGWPRYRLGSVLDLVAGEIADRQRRRTAS